MQKHPLVSVCIPTFNRSGYLGECLASALSQDYSRIEVIVCDNASTDNTGDVVKAYVLNKEGIPVKYFKNEENIGMVGNWNLALSLALGDYVIIVSDDDVLATNAISMLVSLLIESVSTEFSYSPVRIMDSCGGLKGCSRVGPEIESCSSFIRNTLTLDREPFPSALLFKRESAISVGGFPDIKNGADVAFRLALAQRGGNESSVRCYPLPVVFYRVHDNALSAKPTLLNESYALLQAWLVENFKDARSVSREALFQLLLVRARTARSGDLACLAKINIIIAGVDARCARWLYSGILGFRWSYAVSRALTVKSLTFLFPGFGWREFIRIKRNRSILR